MRYGLLFLGLPLAVFLCQGWIERAYDHMTTAALSDDARTAIELRCPPDDDRSARECRATLKRLYLSGALDPDKTLRAWCDAVEESIWGGSRPPPPQICVQRYGGWREG